MKPIRHLYPAFAPFVATAASKLAERISTLADLAAAKGETLDKASPIPSSDISLLDLVTRAEFVSVAIHEFQKENRSKPVLWPRDNLRRLNDSCAAISNEINNLKTRIEAIVSRDPEISNFDSNTFIFQYNDGTEDDLSRPFKNIDDNLDNALRAVFPLQSKTGKGAINLLHITLGEIDSQLEQSKKAKEDAKIAARTAKASATNAEKSLNISNELNEQIGKLKSAAASNVENIQSRFDEIQEIISSLEETRAKSIELETFADSFRDKFSAFDNSADERERKLKNQEIIIGEQIAKLEEAAKFASKTVADTKTALNLGTSHGLSSFFNSAELSLAWPIRFSAGFFIISLGFFTTLIFIAVKPEMIPIIPTDLVPPLPEQVAEFRSEPLTFSNTFSAIADLGIRFLIVFPGIVAIRFSGRILDGAISASRQYKFKKTIAAALPSFKSQVTDEDDPTVSSAVSLKTFEALAVDPEREGRKKSSKIETDEANIFSLIYNNMIKMLSRSE